MAASGFMMKSFDKLNPGRPQTASASKGGAQSEVLRENKVTVKKAEWRKNYKPAKDKLIVSNSN